MTATSARTSPTLARRRQAGLSLVELMISIVIGLLLLAGISSLIAAQSGARGELEKSARQIENGRYALTLMQDEIQHAGYFGQYSGAMAALSALPSLPCNSAANAAILTLLESSLALPLQGYNAPATVPAELTNCLPAANFVAGTDILVVRRAEATNTPATVTNAQAGQLYLQTTPDALKTGVGPDPTPATPTVYTLVQKNNTTPAELRRYVARIFYISPCNVYAAGATACSAAADNGRPVPTLKRLDLSVSGGLVVATETPLVDGIQNMQLDYGVAAATSAVPGDTYVTAPAVADWPNVMAVQINLLARSSETSAGKVDAKTYSMGAAGSVGPFSDAYKRHVYTALARVVNPSSRRE
ncbi:PilW family protein [Noviherbaspirillum sp. L7-7A]|uniref:PilW family protein n=1 Tax=Noviherbaspirillum sp. L7-7A TaxID=2850560 RepID=UPI001C2B8796|nr:PilW family protein [Noviherbaspirillum sp. L7-7A]MBV0881923.1 PilW family protein [Noviherbaspirillum sp. L7-7A]